MTLAEIGGLDAEATKKGGAKPKRVRDVVREWKRIVMYAASERGGGAGADATPATTIGQYDWALDFIDWRRDGVPNPAFDAGRPTGKLNLRWLLEPARGQSITRDVWAMARGNDLAHRRGALPIVPKLPTVRRDPKDPDLRGKLHPPTILSAWFEALRLRVDYYEGAKRRASAREAYLEARLCILTGLRGEVEMASPTKAWVEPAPPGLDVRAFLRVPDDVAKTAEDGEGLIGLVDEAIAIIEELGHGKSDNEPLFTGANHKHAREWACRRIGYERNITLRDLRHFYATFAGKEDPVAGMYAARHKSLETFVKYQHTTLERAASVSASVAGELARHEGHHTGVTTQATPAEASAENPNNAGGEDGAQDRTRTDDLLITNPRGSFEEHLKSCKYCRTLVLECIEKHQIYELPTTQGHHTDAAPGRRRA